MHWQGTPDCQALHDDILSELRQIGIPFLTVGQLPLVSAQIGNLGEFIVQCIGRSAGFRAHDCWPSARSPLDRSAGTGPDLLWIDPALPGCPTAVVVQEVKTSPKGASLYSQARDLIRDTDRLFGTDPEFTLHTRLASLAYRLGRQGRPSDSKDISRIQRQIVSSGNRTSGVRVSPTMVHPLGIQRIDGDLQTIINGLQGKGWPLPSISAVAVAIDDLESRLERMSTDRS